MSDFDRNYVTAARPTQLHIEVQAAADDVTSA